MGYGISCPQVNSVGLQLAVGIQSFLHSGMSLPLEMAPVKTDQEGNASPFPEILNSLSSPPDGAEIVPSEESRGLCNFIDCPFQEKTNCSSATAGLFERHLHSFLAGQQSPLEAANWTELKTGEVRGELEREEKLCLILAGTCCSGSHAVTPSRQQREGSTEEEELYLWYLPAYSRSQPLLLVLFSNPTPQQGERLSVYKYAHSCNEPHSVLEKDTFPIQFGEDSIHP